VGGESVDNLAAQDAVLALAGLQAAVIAEGAGGDAGRQSTVELLAVAVEAGVEDRHLDVPTPVPRRVPGGDAEPVQVLAPRQGLRGVKEPRLDRLGGPGGGQGSAQAPHGEQQQGQGGQQVQTAERARWHGRSSASSQRNAIAAAEGGRRAMAFPVGKEVYGRPWSLDGPSPGISEGVTLIIGKR